MITAGWPLRGGRGKKYNKKYKKPELGTSLLQIENSLIATYLSLNLVTTY